MRGRLVFEWFPAIAAPGGIAERIRSFPRKPARKHRLLAASLLLAAVCAPRPAHATVASDLCTGNPCNVTKTITVDENSVLDFGAADLVFKSSASITIGPGVDTRSVTFMANSIVFEAGAKILGNGDNALVDLEATGGGVQFQGAGSKSKIDLSSNAAGEIDINAVGDITIAGTLDVHGTGDTGAGGTIAIFTSGGQITVNQSIEVGGTGNETTGGSLSLEAQGPITLNAVLDGGASSDGADMSLIAHTGDITVNAKIDISGGNPDGGGGSLDMTTMAGAINTTALILGNAGSGPDDACGDGATVTMTASGNVTLGANINLSGGNGCSGGEYDVTTPAAFIQQASANIDLDAPGSFGVAGTLNIQATGGVMLQAVDLGTPGLGGIATINSGGPVTLLGKVDARGSSNQFGIGGVVKIQGCSVNVTANGKIDTRGAFAITGLGITSITASSTLTIAGSLQAQAENDLIVRSGAPTITGSVTPAPTISVDGTLPTCTVIQQCGDGTVEPPEVCDDGNTQSCDGCSSDCMRMDNVCGDGIPECGEQCDDGNNVDGDGCQANCTLPGARGTRITGAPRPVAGCLAEWELALANPAVDSHTGLPATIQECVDGDPGCDQDAANNKSCTFAARVCLKVPDPRIPTCVPGPISLAKVRLPRSLNHGALADRQNAAAISEALMALGGTVELGTTKVQAGTPLSTPENCTASFNLIVPRQPKRAGKKVFNLLSQDSNGLTMSTNEIRLECDVNNAVCGNGIQEVTEECDDGNTNACDGCSPTCKIERCGDGITQCNEECDDGPLNGTPGDSCSATCTQAPPTLRIPGGGPAALDCGFEWSLAIADNAVTLDTKGVPRVAQTCVDNDPSCDFDPRPGVCRMRVWGCVSGADNRLGCSALGVNSVSVLYPTTRAAGSALQVRNSLTAALAALGLPSQTSERCTSHVDLPVSVGGRYQTLKVKASLANGKSDADTLKLRCLAK